MTYTLLADQTATKEQLIGQSSRPEFRKTTNKMAFASAAIETAMNEVPELNEFRSRINLVLGTISGELESTRDFLTTLDRAGIARPVLFQNSLHNSTTGFLAMHFGFTGPAVTLTHHVDVAEQTLNVALSLLTPTHPFSLLVQVECNPQLRDYPLPQPFAQAIFIASVEGAKLIKRSFVDRKLIPNTPLGFSTSVQATRQ
jgi:hypothetical protein